MTGESNEEVTNVTNENASSEEQAQRETGVTQEEIQALTAQLEKQSALIEKLRLHEQTSLEREQAEKQKRKGAEGEIDALKAEFRKELNTLAINSALERELITAGAKNVDLSKRLLDTTDVSVMNGKADTQKIREAIAALKETDNYLFADATSTATTVKPTTPARAGEGGNEDVVKRDIRAARTRQELEAVLKKHNVGTN